MTELEIAVLRTMERIDFTPVGEEVFAAFMLHHRGTTIRYEEIKKALTKLVEAGKLSYDRVDAMGGRRPDFRYLLKWHN